MKCISVANSSPTTSEEFFEAKYRRDADPWNFTDSEYELSRYAATMAALEGQHFECAFEPGCSIGILTRQLAGICGRVDAIEISMTAVRQAQERCRDLTNVNIRHGSLPDDIPDATLDLIVFSEIGYYFEIDDLRQLVATLVARLTSGGVFLAVHWLGSSDDHLLSGDDVHQVLSEAWELKLAKAQRFSRFRLDKWTRR